MKAFALKIVDRWGAAWRDALASAIAAILSWVLAQHIFGHTQPIFAAITAIVCLSPGLPSHSKQAAGLLVGVATGIVVGELALFLPDTMHLARIGGAVFFAIFIATSYGLTPVVAIQAGISALLVLAFGPATAGAMRMMDVALGAVIGLIFSQVLLTPDPVRMVDGAARDLLTELAKGFKKCAEALRERNVRKGEAALTQFSMAHQSVIALDTGIASARDAVRWSVRGWLAASEVQNMAARYDRQAIRLYASTLLFGEALADGLRNNEAPAPEGLHERIDHVARRCIVIAGGRIAPEAAVDRQDSSSVEETAWPVWRSCIEHLQDVEDALVPFERASATGQTKSVSDMSSSTRTGQP